MAARGIGFCNGHLSPTRLNSSQKPSHSALPHSRPCTPVCRYTRFAFPLSVPGHNLPAAPHHSRPLPAVLQSPSNRSVLHEPSQRTAFSVPASPAYPRSGTSLPEEPTSLPRQPHYESQEAAPALPAQNASRGETASRVPFPGAPGVAEQSRSAWQEISSPCAP